MLSTQLNGGSISKYRPIGHDGEPIYKNAEAFIAALKLHPSVGVNKTNCLAAPKISADGLNIDWYVPFPPQNPSGEHQIVSWASATAQEQQQAMAILKDFEQSLRKLGMDLQRRGADGQSKLMVSYLTGQKSSQNLPAIHFPSPECVYIVDGWPVITFWGFESGGDDLTQSPSDILTRPVNTSYMAPQNTAFAAGATTLGGAAMGAQPAQAGQVPPEEPSRGHKCFIFGFLPLWLSWLLGILLLLLLLLLLWWLFPLIWAWLASLLGFNVPKVDLGGVDSGGGSFYEQVESSPVDLSQGGSVSNVYNGQPDVHYGGDIIDNSVNTPAPAGEHNLTLNTYNMPVEKLDLPNTDLPLLSLSGEGLNGKFKGLDLDGDGAIDAVDINDDNVDDGWAVDPNNDGIVDAAAFDFDKDGYIEGLGMDLDGDGQLDSIGLDLNKDGMIDGIDTDGDGKADLLFGEKGGYVPADKNATVVPGIDPNADLLPADTPVLLDPVPASTSGGLVVGDDAFNGDGFLNALDNVAPTDASVVPADTVLSDGAAITDGAVLGDGSAALGDGNANLGTGDGGNGLGDGAGDGSQPPADGVLTPTDGVLTPVDPALGVGEGNGDGTGDGSGTGSDVAADGTDAAQQQMVRPTPPDLDPSLYNNANQSGNNLAGVNNSILGGEKNKPNISFTQDTIKSQGVKVLNGQWGTRSALMDSSNGRPLQLGYSMQDGKGQVEITRADGSKCVAPASAATSGKGVMISTSGRAICPDKSSYQIPNVSCEVGSDGQVRCKGQSGQSIFPIQLFSDK